MIILLALLLLFRQYGTSAAPIAASFPEPSAYNATLFVRDDAANACPGRSVWDIIWSCLATTFAVTWVSVHPNVPFFGEGNWPLLKRRIFLMCLALLAPEVMIMWAFKQWRGAATIMKTINTARPSSSSFQWTMTHAHFLQMGGFKLNHLVDKNFRDYDYEEDFRNYIYSYSTIKHGLAVEESFLTFEKFRELLVTRSIDFPETTEKEIEDRSKSDALSKGVALLQISWFIFQLIARAHQHLAITEIELTTAALAGLNSVMYLFWWNKPFDVRCPIVVRTKELELRIVEALRERETEEKDGNDSQISSDGDEEEQEGDTDDDGIEHSRDEQGILSCNADGGERTSDTAEQFVEEVVGEEEGEHSGPRKKGGNAGNANGTVDQVKWTFPDSEDFDQSVHLMTTPRICVERAMSGIRSMPARIPARFRQAFTLPRSLAARIHGTIRGAQGFRTNGTEYPAIRRGPKWIWTCCKTALTRLVYMPYLLMFLPFKKILFNSSYPDIYSFKDAKDYMDRKPSFQMLFDESDMEWIMSMMFYCERVDTKPLLVFSALAGVAFGSVHCAAWNFNFPSFVEQVLWRTASLTIVGVCLCILIGMPLYNTVTHKKSAAYFKAFDRYRDDQKLPISERRGVKHWGEDTKYRIWTLIYKALETIPAVIYPLARLSLLTIALSSLRDLPGSAFETVMWTKFIPHF